MEDLCRKEIDQSDKSLLQTFEIHFVEPKSTFFLLLCVIAESVLRNKKTKHLIGSRKWTKTNQTTIRQKSKQIVGSTNCGSTSATSAKDN